jgi:membrane-associated phospholipid phosphatase
MWLVVEDGNEAGIDRSAFRVLAIGPQTLLGRHARPVADAGTALAIIVSLLVIVALVRRRRWIEATVIIVGYPLVWLASEILKELAQRSRPPAPVIPAGGFSFPSTDSAISIGFLAVAIALARLTPGMPRKVAIVALGILCCVITGVLMVGFRDHYLTDVLGGWGLGLATFSACALAAIFAGERAGVLSAGDARSSR